MLHLRFCVLLTVSMALTFANGSAQTGPSSASSPSGSESQSVPISSNCQDAYVEAALSNEYASTLQLCSVEAAKGVPEAQYVLGALYQDGDGVAQDSAKAVEWFREAADQGYNHAQLEMGRASQRGVGIPQDLPAALRWFKLAAAGGDKDAEKELSDLQRRMATEPSSAAAPSAPSKLSCRTAKEPGKNVCDYQGLFQFLVADNVAVSQDAAKVVAEIGELEFSIELVESNVAPEHFIPAWFEAKRNKGASIKLTSVTEVESLFNGVPTTLFDYCFTAPDGTYKKSAMLINPIAGSALVRTLTGPASSGCGMPSVSADNLRRGDELLNSIVFSPPFKQRLLTETSQGFLQRTAKDPSASWAVNRTVGVRYRRYPKEEASMGSVREGVPGLFVKSQWGDFVLARWPDTWDIPKMEEAGLKYAAGCGSGCKFIGRTSGFLNGEPTKRDDVFDKNRNAFILVFTGTTHHSFYIYGDHGVIARSLADRFEFID